MELERPVSGFHSFASTCAVKTRYEDEGKAWSALLLKRREGWDAGRTIQPYRCEHCGLWHLGNRPGTKKHHQQGG